MKTRRNKINKKRIQFYKGQSLLEVVLSIGIASMVISALIILGAASVKTINSSLRRNEASKLANEGIEAMRFYRDQIGHGFGALINDDGGETTACYQINTLSPERMVDNTAGPPEPPTGYPSVDCTYTSTEAWDVISLIDVDFQRRMFAEYIDLGTRDEILITSTVRWPESDTGAGGDGFQEVVMTTILTNWGE